METTRRVYLYLLSFAGLGTLAGGVANLLQVLLDVALRWPSTSTNSERFLREGVSMWGAAALVGLPIWALHWHWAQRTTRDSRHAEGSTVRRLYLYAVLAVALLNACVASGDVIQAALDAATGRGFPSRTLGAIIRALPFLGVSAVVWLYHWRVAATDRRSLGEEGGPATLRRWYLYGTALVALVFLLSGMSSLLASIWRGAADLVGSISARPALPLDPVPPTLLALIAWLGHWRILPSRLEAQDQVNDQRGILRSVYLFLGLGVTVSGTLFGTSQLLFYALGRALGVERPGGVGGELLTAAAGPSSMLAVYGLGWAYQRAAIRHQAALLGELPAQLGIRRLYRYVVALLALAALASGLIRLLWTVVDLALGGQRGTFPGAETWRSDVALGATLVIVALPVWLLHWRPTSRAQTVPAEARSLSRRLYVYLALIGGMLGLLGAGAGSLYRLLGLLLGGDASRSILHDLALALAAASVAGLVSAHHWHILRMDSALARTEEVPVAQLEAEVMVEAVIRVRATSEARLAEALGTLKATGVDLQEIEGFPGRAAP